LRTGRNDEDTAVIAHTLALRPDLSVDHEGAVLSAHSQETLAVTEAAAQFIDRPFTVEDVFSAIESDNRAVVRRQVQTIIGELRDSGYIRTHEEPRPDVAGEYELVENHGTEDIELPGPDIGVESGDTANEILCMRDY